MSIAARPGKEPGASGDDHGGGYVCSFDVYDTCIARRFAYPRDLFYALGQQLAPPGSPALEISRFARDFQRRRVRAEKKAYREVRPHESATIHEIYARMSLPTNLDLGVEALIAAEVALERESTYPIPAMVERINQLRASGRRIIFISDMYLPDFLLAPILVSHGVMREADKLYVSCDARLTKASGNLYHHVLRNESIPAERLEHIGDDLWADVRMAERAGIKARHFTASALTSREVTLAGRRLSRSEARSFFPALSRRTRLHLQAGPQHAPDSLDDAMQSVIAPFLISFVDWVLEKSERAGIERLYFVARDGQILFHIAKILSHNRTGPELKYLHGSRRAWVAPSITPDTRGWERLLVTAGQKNSRLDILSRAGLSEEKSRKILEFLGVSEQDKHRILDENLAHAFVDDVLACPPARSLLEDASAECRETAIAYFQQEGLLDGSKWALVDAGWSLNCQAALARTLQAAGFGGAPHGYYIALARDHLPREVAGGADAFSLPVGNLFSRRRVIIEHCFTPSTHSSTIAYRVDGSRVHPVLGDEIRSQDELAYASRLHATVLAMAEIVARDPKLASGLRRYRTDVLVNAERLLRRPQRTDASAMAGFGTVADLRHDALRKQPLCRPLTMSDVFSVIGMAISRKFSFRSPSYMWLEGSNALSPWYVRLPISGMLLLDELRQKRGISP